MIPLSVIVLWCPFYYILLHDEVSQRKNIHFITKFPSWTLWVRSPSPAPIIKNLWDRLREGSAFLFQWTKIATLEKENTICVLFPLRIQ